MLRHPTLQAKGAEPMASPTFSQQSQETARDCALESEVEREQRSRMDETLNLPVSDLHLTCSSRLSGVSARSPGAEESQSFSGALAHLIPSAARAPLSPTRPLAERSADVPPSGVPVTHYKRVYDGVLHLPPGKTKRALGRMRLVCCCVVTTECRRAIFIALPIVFFITLFLLAVVPHGEWFSYMLTTFLTASSLACLTLSVTLDPGIIPPAPQAEQPTYPAMVVLDGDEVECKVCTTCHIARPPRSSHCKFCDVCVEEFDHHCGIIGSCVGKRTFRFFGGFFIWCGLLALYVLIRSFMLLVMVDFTRTKERPGLLRLVTACILCLLGSLGGCMCTVPFASRYILLSARNRTYKEAALGEGPLAANRSADRDRWYLNIARRWFGPMSRSRIPYDYYV